MGVGTAFKELDAMAHGAGNAGRSLMGDSDVYQGYRKVQEMAAVIGFASYQANRASAQAAVKQVEAAQRYADNAIANNPIAAGYRGSGLTPEMIQADIASRISRNNADLISCQANLLKAQSDNNHMSYGRSNAAKEYARNSQTVLNMQNQIDALNEQNRMLSKAASDFDTLNRVNEQSKRLDSARADISAGQQNARYVQTIAVNKILGGSFVGDAYNMMNAVRMVSNPIKNMHHKSVEASLRRRMAFDEGAKARLSNLALKAAPGSGVERMLNKASGRFSRESTKTAEKINRNNMKRTKAGRKKLIDDDRARKAATRKAVRRNRRETSLRNLTLQRDMLHKELMDALADARHEFMMNGGKGSFFSSKEYRRYLIKYSKKQDMFSKLDDRLGKKNRRMAKRSKKDLRKMKWQDWKNRRALRKANRRAFFAKLRELNTLNLLKTAASKVIGIAVGALLQVILYVAISTGAMILIAFFILHFASDMINSIRTDLTGELNNSQNWCQLILDHLYYDMGQEFEQVIKDDAFSHYFTYYYIVTPYYNVPLSVDYSTFGKSWIWEEADNTSRWVLSGNITDLGEDDEFTYGNPLYTVNDGAARNYDAEGYLTGTDVVVWEEGKGESLDTYKDVSGAMEGATDMVTWGNNAAKLRTEVDPRLNVFPIMAMMHTKYIDNLNYEEWVTALAYTYYMYAMSHDVAKYDSNESFRFFNLGGNDNGLNYEEMQRENAGMSGYNVNVFFHGERHFQHLSSGTNNNNYIYVNSDYMGTEQRVYLFNYNAWERKYQFAGAGCDNVYYHSAATHPDGNGGYIIEYGLSGQADDTGDNHINGIYCETNVKLVQLFRRAVYEYIYSGTGNTAFGGYQTMAESQMDYAYTVYYLHKLANGEESGYRGTDVDALCKMMGISVEYLRDNLYIPPSNSSVYFYNRLGVTVNGVPGVQGYDFKFNNNEFTHVYDWRKCPDGQYITISLAAPNPDDKCDCGGAKAANIYDEAYSAILHDGACLVYHGASGITNNFDPGYSDRGCGRVYTCGGEVNARDENGNECHKHTDSCSSHWQCNCGRYSIPDTVYVCAGHCAGHLIPSTTTVQRLSYEGLAQGDGFKTTYWLTEQDIMGENAFTDVSQTIFGLGRVLGEADDAVWDLTELRANIRAKYGTANMPTLPEWKLFWLKRAQGWFGIFPNSPRAFFTVIGKRFIYAAAGGIDFFTNNLADFLENVFINHTGVMTALQTQWEDIKEALSEEKADPMNEKTLGDNDARDNLGFQGWFAPPSDYDYPTRYSQSAMSELKTFYGSFYDSNGDIIYQDPQRGFLVGVRNWKEFDVYFPEELLNALGQQGYYGP